MKPMLDWDELYRNGQYLKSWELDRPSPELVEFLATRPPAPRQSALDLGCGSGRDAIFLARSGYRTCGVDVSAEALELATRNSAREGLQVTWLRADVLALPFDADTFELVTDRGCFHHLPEEEREVYAREVARVLKPSGTLLLRGCRHRRFPFVPVTEDSLRRHFSSQLFDMGSIEGVELVTNSGVIAGNLCQLQRR